ncbi:MAG: FtsX-like permease family protein [Bacteroidota bacterium]
MFRNYLLTAYRSLTRNKWVSLISILGLSVGMATGLLSYLHIQYEQSFDQYHTKSDRIYRIVTGNVETGEGWVGISAPIPPKLKSDIPEMEDYVRLTKLRRDGKVVVHYDNQYFNEANFFLADAALFSVFNLPLLQGDRERVFDSPDGMVVSETEAVKLFGDKNPIGKIIRINDQHEFRVTGVMEDVPENSHFDLDYVVSFQNLETMKPGTSLTGNWGQYNYYAYALLRQNADHASVVRKIQSIKVPLKEGAHSFERIGLQPLADIHFVDNRGNLKPSYNRRYLFIYGAAALGLILISLVNFINLKTAGSSKRVKEVGVRKTIGASRPQLMGQFVSEAFLLCTISLVLAAALMRGFLLPYINDLFGATISFNFLSPVNIVLGLLFALVISFLAGGYIGFFVTSFSPVKALKSQVKTGSGKSVGLRDVLLGLQFLVSIILIGSSLIISKQMRHISNMSLGLNPDQVVNIPLYVEVEKEKRSVLKNELGNLPHVSEVSLNSFNPGGVNWNQTVWWEGQAEDESMYIISVDPDFFETVDIKLLEGNSDLIKKNLTDRYTYVLNESARQHIGWEKAEGKMFAAFGEDSRRAITGVIEDFYFQSLHNEVRPCLLVVGDLRPSQLYLKTSAANIPETLEAAQQKLATLVPGLPFEYSFLDEKFAELYTTEQQAQKIISFYTFICILIAIFGLYGLLTFEINERTKEIAIRKILGGSSRQIGQLLSKNFIRAALVAGAVGVPIVWWLMNGWLANFDYRTNIDLLSIFAPVILLSVLVTLTVWLKLFSSKKQDPVEELRYE